MTPKEQWFLTAMREGLLIVPALSKPCRKTQPPI